MTKNGKVAHAAMEYEAYEERLHHDRYVMKLREAEIEAQYRSGSISQDELDVRIRRILELSS